MATAKQRSTSGLPAGSGIERLEPRSMMAVQPVPPALLPPRSIDGTGNNPAHVEWGSTAEDLLRTSAAAYADGIAAPSGGDRPSPRLVSNALARSPEGGVTNDRDFSAFVYAWGQFLDHDLSLTATASPREAFPVAVPAGDPAFDPTATGVATIPMSRSAWNPLTGTGVGNPRQQTNAITAFIDGSQVYGSDATRAAALREFSGGRLKTGTGNLLPFNTAGLANANDAHRVADDRLFLAGDIRANENPELIALHTLFVREHNRLAAAAAARNPSWTDEQLYQHARRTVIAELQDITYTEFLPALLGGATPAAAALRDYRGYRPDVDPGIATEFSTAAFRVGHSMLGDDIQFLRDDGSPVRDPLPLRDAFFNAPVVSETGIDPILKYLATDRAQEIDTAVVEDVRDFLFGAPGQGGFDLAALNIQRGRDHGLADYNAVRAAYGLARLTSFAQITPDKATQDALAATYGSIDKVDLWVGGLAERHLPGSSLGETFTRIVVDQFTRLRDGDRWWYQNRGVLPADVARDVQATSLADIIRRNTGLVNLQPDVFFFRVSVGGSVFADLNRDGRRQAPEAGIAGVAVTLVNAAGITVAATTTDARGRYVFEHLDTGTYRAVVTRPNADPAVGRAVVITRGTEVRDVDVGVAPPARPVPPRPAPTPRPGPSPRVLAFASLAGGDLAPAVAGRRPAAVGGRV